VYGHLQQVHPAARDRTGDAPEELRTIQRMSGRSGARTRARDRDRVRSEPPVIPPVCGRGLWSRPFDRASGENQPSSHTARIPVKLVKGSGEKLPFEDRSFDTVVMTFTLCSIPDAALAVREMRRVLRPEGELHFVEHGQAPDPSVARWQDWLTPAWKHLGGGCHLNLKIDDLIKADGFRIERLSTDYLKSAPRAFSFIYEGSARPA
jgi:SAM-dependent methyltransferase